MSKYTGLILLRILISISYSPLLVLFFSFISSPAVVCGMIHLLRDQLNRNDHDDHHEEARPLQAIKYCSFVAAAALCVSVIFHPSFTITYNSIQVLDL